ncbi:hypothetical protein MTO96_017431 [Rhipicephalus appendiculatus]
MTTGRPGMPRYTVQVRNTTYDNEDGVVATSRPMQLSAGGRPMQPRPYKLDSLSQPHNPRVTVPQVCAARSHAKGEVSEWDRKRALINRPRGPMRRGAAGGGGARAAHGVSRHGS